MATHRSCSFFVLRAYDYLSISADPKGNDWDGAWGRTIFLMGTGSEEADGLIRGGKWVKDGQGQPALLLTEGPIRTQSPSGILGRL